MAPILRLACQAVGDVQCQEKLLKQLDATILFAIRPFRGLESYELEDLKQEGRLAILTNLPRVEAKASVIVSPEGYFAGIVFRWLRNIGRKSGAVSRRRREVDLGVNENNPGLMSADPRPDIENSIYDGYLSRAAFSRATRNEWRCAELCAEGLSQAEVAKVLGISTNAVKQRMAQLRYKMNAFILLEEEASLTMTR